MRRQLPKFSVPLLVPALLVCASFPRDLGAQESGTITGTVTDAVTAQPIEGARISLTALNRMVVSQEGGRFLIADVPAGTHELRVEMLGHADLSRTVTVTAGGSVSLALRMEPEAFHLHELVVTGTAFEESPVELPYSVSISGRRTLAELGSPQAFDFFRNLPASQGILGARQGWYSTRPPGLVSETVASVNLRGLGASRTLVLLNGRRQVPIPIRLAGGRFVDVNAFPSIALERIETVKEGASAVYGSDAVTGVVNFLTRSSFEGLEVSGSHEYFSGAGETNVGAIWGSELGERAHAVVSAEAFFTQELAVEERDWTLGGFVPGGGGWSYTGNPGAFLFPRLMGNETPDEFTAALLDAHYGGWGGVFVDPQCEGFGGFLEPDETCRFDYGPFDNLTDASRQIRAFAELNGEFGEASSYHLEALWAEASTPNWLTTPSYPPISPYNGSQLIEPSHPGRQVFCNSYGQAAGFAGTEACLENDWYFFGRMVGNSGPPRTLRRDSRTQRFAASLEHAFEGFGGRESSFELAANFSRSTGNANLPGEYLHRKFLAFRGFGGPNCGVGVVADPSSPSGMALGPLNGQVAGQGNCMYYNPFSNAHRNSVQPGARYRDQDNPDYVPGLENTQELINWINDESNLDNEANLLVVDALLKGALAEETEYAVGYQFRRLSVGAEPNDPGNLDVTPCAVPGDHSCPDPFGPFHFTGSFFPYDDGQTVHRFFAESRIHLGDRIHGQVAANYEFHGSIRSFDPKVAVRVELAEPIALRASVQTTFQTPSVDDLNEGVNTGLEYVSAAGIYKGIDTYGDKDLVPERAFTYNVGATFQLPRFRASIDYWDYDFENIIDVLPYEGVASLYAAGGSQREAVKDFVTCPGNRQDGSCDIQSVERIEVRFVNWPGVRMSGVDFHASTRIPRGEGVVSLELDGTYGREFTVRALDVAGVEVLGEHDATGKLNWANPIAPPLPQWKSSFSAGYHVGDYSVVNYLNTVSGYTNEAFVGTQYEHIDRFLTWDLSLLRRASDQFDVGLSVLNALDAPPPLVRWEASYDGFTHSPKGRRIKLSLTYRMGN
ncbi:MAG: TonB-dependent receptor [Gemmatimonadetes bacterium]|nr:TonB-dependent receptor [Gemmatimonadota bacterium]MYB99121.1 TonB-dependent receptor [Gemmatimonadota bacterium]MYI47308.1 TonB-dependent receptor [Gemmatimonadota bacterium]